MRRAKDFWRSLGQLLSLDCDLALLQANSLTQEEWKRVIEFAFRKGVAPELHARLRLLRVEEKLPTDWFEALRASHQLNEMIHSEYRKVFRDILEVSNAIGIRLMLLKGGIDVISPEDAINSSRVVSDLDIIVMGDGAENLQRDLIKSGFREDDQFKSIARDASKHHHLAPLWHKTHNLYVEIHRSLGPAIQFGTLNRLVFSDPVKRDMDGLTYYVPPNEFRFLHNFVHQMNDEKNGGGRSFRQLLDLYRLTNKLAASEQVSLSLKELGGDLASDWKYTRYFVSDVFEAAPKCERFELQSFLRMHFFWLSLDYKILRLCVFWGLKLRQARKQKDILQKISNPNFYKKAISDCLSFVKK